MLRPSEQITTRVTLIPFFAQRRFQANAIRPEAIKAMMPDAKDGMRTNGQCFGLILCCPALSLTRRKQQTHAMMPAGNQTSRNTVLDSVPIKSDNLIDSLSSFSCPCLPKDRRLEKSLSQGFQQLQEGLS